MAKKKRSPKRSASIEERKRGQKQRLLANDKARLFALSPGGSRLSPLQVSSTAIIESRAAGVPCPQCGGRLAVDDHSVDHESEELLRLVLLHCVLCAVHQKLWLRVVTPKVN